MLQDELTTRMHKLGQVNRRRRLGRGSGLLLLLLRALVHRFPPHPPVQWPPLFRFNPHVSDVPH